MDRSREESEVKSDTDSKVLNHVKSACPFYHEKNDGSCWWNSSIKSSLESSIRYLILDSQYLGRCSFARGSNTIDYEIKQNGRNRNINNCKRGKKIDWEGERERERERGAINPNGWNFNCFWRISSLASLCIRRCRSGVAWEGKDSRSSNRVS